MSTFSISPASAPSPVTGEASSSTQASPAPGDLGTVSLWRCLVLLLLAIVVALAYWFNPPIDIQSQAGVVMNLPVLIGDYYGQEGVISDAEHLILPKDTEFARRDYEDGQGHQIICSIVLSGAEQRSIHRPEACLVGQGWDIIGQEYVPMPLASGHQLVARRLTLERREPDQNGGSVVVRAFYVYWFVGQNVATPSEMQRVLLSNWDRVVHNRSHRWAYVSFFSLITDDLQPNGLNADKTQALLADFARQIVPTFQISEMPSKAGS
ncbi:MAG: EpsI family protein [Methylacidiphilales bacterium]|nr:EpsI family protein [Candidatus Methylacidiphilales bacterium]